MRLVGTASRKVGETENGGVRLVGTASRKVGETDSGDIREAGVASTDPFAASFRAKDALEASIDEGVHVRAMR